MRILHVVLLMTGPALLAACTVARAAPGAPQNGLAPCPSTRNCVSSLAPDDAHRVAPLRFTGTPAAAVARLTGIVRSLPRTTVTETAENYLHAECRSAVFRFVDDLEFLFDERDAVIHVRSAARRGSWDLGVNRRRVEEIRARWATAAPR